MVGETASPQCRHQNLLFYKSRLQENGIYLDNMSPSQFSYRRRPHSIHLQPTPAHQVGLKWRIYNLQTPAIDRFCLPDLAPLRRTARPKTRHAAGEPNNPSQGTAYSRKPGKGSKAKTD